MAPYYRLVTAAGALKMDEELLKQMEKENEEELEKLDKRLKDAEETEGESEIGDALKAKAIYLTKIGERASSFTGLIHVVSAANSYGFSRICCNRRRQLKLKHLLLTKHQVLDLASTSPSLSSELDFSLPISH